MYIIIISTVIYKQQIFFFQMNKVL